MTSLAEFPIDPQLVAAIKDASTRNIEFAKYPRAWRKAVYKDGRKLKGIRNARAKRKVIAERDGAQCTYCGRVFEDLDDATLDHVIPNQLLRRSQVWNLVLSCQLCNFSKNTRIPAVLMPLLSALLYQLAKLNAAPVERSLMQAGGA